jgi:hypothetical protein
MLWERGGCEDVFLQENIDKTSNIPMKALECLVLSQRLRARLTCLAGVTIHDRLLEAVRRDSAVFGEIAPLPDLTRCCNGE